MLLNMEETLTCSIPNDVETLSFGLDSIDNVQTSFEGALDPIHGMFWTWNAGYVNSFLIPAKKTIWMFTMDVSASLRNIRMVPMPISARWMNNGIQHIPMLSDPHLMDLLWPQKFRMLVNPLRHILPQLPYKS